MITLLSSPFIGIVLAFTLWMGSVATPAVGGPASIPLTFRSILKEETILPTSGQPELFVYDRLNCAACDGFMTTVLPDIKKNHADTGAISIRVAMIPNPANEDEVRAAESLKCAADQKQFWPMHAAIHASGHPWNEKWFVNQSKSLGMDAAAFTACLDNGTFAADVEHDFTESEKAGITQFPTLLIGPYRMLGSQPVENVEKVLRELKDAGQGTRKPNSVPLTSTQPRVVSPN